MEHRLQRNIWDGIARELAECWRLTKGAKVARCGSGLARSGGNCGSTRPVNFCRLKCRDGDAVTTAAAWREAMTAKGWR